MAGTLVAGITRSGKSLWLKRHGIPTLRASGIPVCVLDPVFGGLDPNQAKAIWGADWVTDDPYRFVAACRKSHGCAWVVDEMSRWKYKELDEIEYIAVASGNHGNLGIFVAQRLMMVRPNIRNQCETAVIFNQTDDDLEDLAARFNQPQIMAAAKFPKGVFMQVEPFKTPVIGRLF